MRKVLLAALIATTIAAAGLAAATSKHSEQHSDDDDGVSIIHIVDGDTGHFFVRSDDLDLSATWKGDFVLSASGKSFESVDGEIEIETKESTTRRRVTFEGRGDEIDVFYAVNKRNQPMNEETKRIVEELVLTFARASGVQADERVRAILAKDGADAAIAEAGAAIGSHSAMRYIRAIAEHAQLTSEQVAGLAKQIKTLDGDHAIRSAIAAFFEHQDLAPPSRAVLLEAAKAITGDHEIRVLLEAVAEGALNADATETALLLIGRISGDHEFYVAAASLLENDGFGDDAAARLLDLAAAQVSGDHDLRMIVDEAAARAAKSETVAAAAVRALSSIESDHDCSVAIETLADVFPRTSPHWVALIEAAGAIGSDHDAAVALETIAAHMPADKARLKAYRAAAARIGSDHDRQRALEAIAR